MIAVESLDVKTRETLLYGASFQIEKGSIYGLSGRNGSGKSTLLRTLMEKGSIKAAENVDGTKSHGKTLAGSGVPSNIRNKAKNLADYKKGQKDWNNMKKAKSQKPNS